MAWLLFFMPYLNVEIKARCPDPSVIREYLRKKHARFVGTDQQTDTYFNVPKGRLKLREGPIENNLIYYERENEKGPKSSHFQLVQVDDPENLRSILTKAYGVKVVVSKTREIYYLDNVKFHIDDLPGLGCFCEIEAGNILAEKSAEELEEQCRFYLSEFGIEKEELVAESYSEMMGESFKMQATGSGL